MISGHRGGKWMKWREKMWKMIYLVVARVMKDDNACEMVCDAPDGSLGRINRASFEALRRSLMMASECHVESSSKWSSRTVATSVAFSFLQNHAMTNLFQFHRNATAKPSLTMGLRLANGEFYREKAYRSHALTLFRNKINGFSFSVAFCCSFSQQTEWVCVCLTSKTCQSWLLDCEDNGRMECVNCAMDCARWKCEMFWGEMSSGSRCQVTFSRTRITIV